MLKPFDSLFIIINSISLLTMVLVLKSVLRIQHRQKTMLNTNKSKIEVFQVYMAVLFYAAVIVGSTFVTTTYVLSN